MRTHHWEHHRWVPFLCYDRPDPTQASPQIHSCMSRTSCETTTAARNEHVFLKCITFNCQEEAAHTMTLDCNIMMQWHVCFHPWAPLIVLLWNRYLITWSVFCSLQRVQHVLKLHKLFKIKHTSSWVDKNCSESWYFSQLPVTVRRHLRSLSFLAYGSEEFWLVCGWRGKWWSVLPATQREGIWFASLMTPPQPRELPWVRCSCKTQHNTTQHSTTQRQDDWKKTSIKRRKNMWPSPHLGEFVFATSAFPTKKRLFLTYACAASVITFSNQFPL